MVCLIERINLHVCFVCSCFLTGYASDAHVLRHVIMSCNSKYLYATRFSYTDWFDLRIANCLWLCLN